MLTRMGMLRAFERLRDLLAVDCRSWVHRTAVLDAGFTLLIPTSFPRGELWKGVVWMSGLEDGYRRMTLVEFISMVSVVDDNVVKSADIGNEHLGSFFNGRKMPDNRGQLQ